MLVFEAHTDVVSWVDENGVRHYSNVGGSGSSSDVKKMEEYKSDPSDKGSRHKSRDGFEVLKMYENDRKKHHEKEQKALEEKLKREEEASKKAAEIKMEKMRNEIKKIIEEKRKIDARLKKR